jgi:hypothetical protein
MVVHPQANDSVQWWFNLKARRESFLISYPARTAMPTCGFPARWTPEAAKLCAVSSPVVPGVSLLARWRLGLCLVTGLLATGVYTQRIS